MILTAIAIAAEAGSEPIATGDVLDGSTLGGSPFCAGGTILDTHASNDPAMEPYGLIDRTITCVDGTLRMGLVPELMPGPTQTGSWTMVSGTGSFTGMRGSGTMETVYDPGNDQLAHERYAGTVSQ